MRLVNLLMAVFVALSPALSQAQVVINEVLANEPGSGTSLEWVELFNSDSISVNLANWKFAEGGDTTVFSDQIVMPPNGYLILVRKLVSIPPDVNSFEGKWGDGSGVWGDAPSESFPAIEAKMSLTNSAGTVTLISPIDSVQNFNWNRDAGDGISWEKMDPLAGDDSTNWKICALSQGSTPGNINSVTPAENDLTIVEFYSEPDNPEENAVFDLKLDIQNLGLSTSPANSLTIFDDLNFNQIMEREEELSAGSIPQLGVTEVFTFTAAAILTGGNHRLVAGLDTDDKIYNNQKSLDLRVGEFLTDIIINEIMAAPDLNQNQPEWMELYNRSEQTVNLKNLQLGDDKKQSIITAEDMFLEPGRFLIATEDRNDFLHAYPSFTGQLVQIEGWQTLDNSGDTVILKDSLGFVMEKVAYPSQSLKGVSWERIDYEKSSSEPDNWWRSVDSSGSTPGKQNSVQATFTSGIGVKIEPNPFSPDEDGFDDLTEIEFTIPLGVDLTMKIYDRRGRLVRTLLDNEPKVSGKISWDGKNNDRNKVRSGVYVLFIEAKGEVREVKKAAIAVTKGK